ncbi:TonB-dependent receptor [Pedobacter sp. BS3]|uniref:SusC/RagA family TonB-linked outer membrane protein n=1 Tax=Pedobacter sp. BS3 TaxID=2567937 RepID=UPI0011F06BEF|nr:TonB-dependent receptor [Pedobacter sp. BS3]TZF81003.1 TonB-dependent receptor [Pedobacter sp. BS3]
MKRLLKHPIHLFLLFAALCYSSIALAQAEIIKGKVTAQSDNGPLPGTTVAVKSTGKKVVTDANGNYQIEAGNNDMLVFTSVGFITREIPVSGKTTVNAVLASAITNLEEVVVVGYGTQKKKDITGAVASVDRKRLEDLPNTNFAQALQGAVAGVSIDQSSAGAEGNSNDIQIRGSNSITASNTPLIVLDGIIYNGSISDINPTDIESIEVLKDASSAAIYGSRGSNGVILITTKKGTRGKPTITYDGFYGIQHYANLPDMMSPEEFYQFKQTREPGVITASEQAVYSSKNFPNWADLVTRTGQRTQHSLGVSGGSENTRYYLSGTYLGVKGIAINDDFKRVSTRVNVESNVTKWLTFGTNTQLSYNNRSGLPATFAGEYGAFTFNPLTTAYNPDGSPTIYPWPEDTFFANPLAPTLASNDDETYKVLTNNYLNIDLPFIKGLSYRLNTGIEYTSREQKTYYGMNTRTGVQNKGSLGTRNNLENNLLIENILNYNRTFGKHTISFTGLYSYQYDVNKADTLDATGFPNDVLTYYQANVALSALPAAGYTKETLISQMARINYSYDSRYLLTLTGRRDGFSGFGENYKYGFFPSVALGWNISNEKFFNTKWVSNLKLRLSYGSNGNQAVGAYRTLAAMLERSYVNGSSTAPGYIPKTLANPNLRWETTNTANLGVDFGLLNGRIQGSLDVYSARTHDLLLKRLISSVHGSSSIVQNLGKTANKGLDLSLNSINMKTESGFSWNSNATFAFVRNKILDLYGDGKNDTLNTWFIGQPINVNFDYIYAGVWQLDEATEAAKYNAKPGYAKVVDLNHDGLINPRDKTIIGSRQPDFIWGLGNTFAYKNFTFYVFMQGVQGTSRSNPLLIDDVNSGVRYNTVKKNWWTPDNPTNEYYANVVGANTAPAHIFQSDSYLRVKDISFSYDIPQKVLRDIHVNKLRVYVNARNLFTITKWTGMDPELTDQKGIPLQKEFIFGLNIGL